MTDSLLIDCLNNSAARDLPEIQKTLQDPNLNPSLSLLKTLRHHPLGDHLKPFFLSNPAAPLWFLSGDVFDSYWVSCVFFYDCDITLKLACAEIPRYILCHEDMYPHFITCNEDYWDYELYTLGEKRDQQYWSCQAVFNRKATARNVLGEIKWRDSLFPISKEQARKETIQGRENLKAMILRRDAELKKEGQKE